MVRHSISRRALLATTAAGVVGLAGCTSSGDGSCRTAFDGVAAVDSRNIEIYTIEATAGQRLYLGFRRREGPRARVGVYDPDEELLLGLEDVARLERVFEISEPGTYTVVTRNESTEGIGRWETTVAVYRGWCGEVF